VSAGATASRGVESPYAWWRLAAALALMSIGSSGMYSMSVALPAVQAEFGVTRADASLPYTLTMIAFGIGCIVMGRIADRFGAMVTVLIGAAGLCTGYIAAGNAGSLWQFSLAHSVLIGFFGTAATFAPLVADISLWFDRRRGIAVAIVMSGNYIAGLWPPVMQHFFETAGWRTTFTGVGIFCLLAVPVLALVMRGRPPATASNGGGAETPGMDPVAACTRELGLSPGRMQALLSVAGVACCVAMSMPQVHMVAYCSDLGYSPARGAEMLAVMLGCGIVSRLASGWISDHIGGLRTLLLGAVLQAIALALFLPYQGIVALYVVSGLFGLFQGGLVPSYAIIIRRYFDPREAGLRTGTVLTATLFGMALGGWMPGAIFDATGSYRAAFINGIGWNMITIAVAVFLLRRASTGPGQLRPVAA
jgi:MFS family permease